MAEGASRRTTVPFAVDLREDRRWVAFAPSARIQPASFRRGFAAVLNTAVARLQLWPSEWEFDLVLQKRTVEEWIAEHDQVFYFRRKVKLTNRSYSAWVNAVVVTLDRTTGCRALTELTFGSWRDDHAGYVRAAA